MSYLDDPERLAELEALNILDSEPEKELDNLAFVARTVAECPIALVSLIDRERQWFKSAWGISISETPRGISFCGYAVEAREPLIVPDASKDPRFENNPLVTGELGIRFYAGHPLRLSSGHLIGTLCVLDYKPRTLSEDQLRSLSFLAKHTAQQIELCHFRKRRQVA